MTFPDPVFFLSLSKTLSGEDWPELWNRGMLAGDGCDPQAADRGATQLYCFARAALTDHTLLPRQRGQRRQSRAFQLVLQVLSLV